MRRALPLLVTVLVEGTVLAGCSTASGPATAADPPGITARGVGTVRGTPDVLTVVLGVQTQGPSAKGALGANSQKVVALLDTLKSRGVAAADVQTSRLSISPTYAPTGRINGYDVSNQVTATLRDIAAAGGLVDVAAAAAGDAVRVQQLAFSIGDDSAPRAQARADAVRQAQAQARQMAAAAGVRLGPLTAITETPASTPFAGDAAGSAAIATSVPIEPGTQELSVTVEVSYAVAR
jgi:uncharacterized protein YggE